MPVLSYRIWKEKYGSDPSVVGAGYQINGHSFTVIGVAPPRFYRAKLAGGGMPDFCLPLTTEADHRCHIYPVSKPAIPFAL